MIFIMITMFFSGGLIPTYLNLKSLHLNNTLWGLIIPWLINTFNMIIMRTAFESIPESLIEAAQIDGATHWKILRSIVLPLSKATLCRYGSVLRRREVEWLVLGICYYP